MDFNTALAFAFRFEGQVSNDPDDHGGLTVYGLSERHHPDVCKKALAAFNQGNHASAKQIAAEVYQKHYWKKIKADLLDPPVAIALFDCAVNLGPKKAVKLLQTALNRIGADVDVDGLMGPATLGAANLLYADRIWPRLNLLRCKHYIGRVNKEPSQKKFLKGWINRVLALSDLLDGVEP